MSRRAAQRRLMAFNAVYDVETGKFYHPDCAPDTPNLEQDDVTGLICEECGGLIDQPDEEDDGDTRTIGENR